jgi:hypothetical protein
LSIQAITGNTRRVDYPGWVDGAPTSSAEQTCAFCGGSPIDWVHPLAPGLVEYRVYGKGHTLPSFWGLCDSCEQTYRSGDDVPVIDLIRSAGAWAWVADDDVAECIGQPLAVFRRADRGARRLTHSG